MKIGYLLLTLALLLPAVSRAKSAQLRLSGTVSEKIDFQLNYDTQKKQWLLTQTTNAHLRAVLTKYKSSQYVVSVRAP